MTEPEETHTSEFETYTCRHFSLANPDGPTERDTPLLLRRFADYVEQVGSIHVLGMEYDGGEEASDKPSFTIFFSTRNSKEDS